MVRLRRFLPTLIDVVELESKGNKPAKLDEKRLRSDYLRSQKCRKLSRYVLEESLKDVNEINQ